jgi:hypothetical protein
MLKLGDTNPSLQTFSTHKWDRIVDRKTGNVRVASADTNRSISIDWLPAAAKKSCISADINDYVINEIPIVAVDLPNRNLDEFPLDEMGSFNEEQGKLTYATFIGKPTFEEHANTDPTKAKGVHFDAQMERDPKTGLWHIVVLAGWDRTKDARLVNLIESQKRTGFSMGAMVNFTRCSHPNCKETSSTGHIRCDHHKGGSNKGGITDDGYLVYERCASVNFIETSSVEDPAQYDAHQRWQQSWSTPKTASVKSSRVHDTSWLPSRTLRW